LVGGGFAGEASFRGEMARDAHDRRASATPSRRV